MNLQISTVEDEPFAPPPFPGTLAGWRAMGSKRATPFALGDRVVPTLPPVDAEKQGLKKERLQVTTDDILIVKTITEKGDTHLITFEGKKGEYDAVFFKKSNK